MAGRTPLYAQHLQAGAKLTEFAGWEMPLYYDGILVERNSVRTRIGLFDLCHMGQIQVEGAGAEDLVDYLVCSDVGSLVPGQARYSLFCNEAGGIVDDLVVFRGAERLRLVVNAFRREADLAWMERWRPSGSEVEVLDLTGKAGLLALQGPYAEEVLSPLVGDLSSLAYYHFREGCLGGQPCLVSRTGYTGEDGFEVFLEGEAIREGWDALQKAVIGCGGRLCGLGARDLLRLEAGYPLWGNEIDEETDPFVAGLGWVVEVDKAKFVGQDALSRIKQSVPERRLVVIVVEGPRVPRHGAAIFAEGAQVGFITSGSFSPLTESGAGLGYVKKEWAAAGTAVQVDIAGRRYSAQVRSRPLYRGSVGRGRQLKD